MSITESEAKIVLEVWSVLLRITLEEAGQILGVSAGTIESWLNNQLPIPPEFLGRIKSTDASLSRVQDLIKKASLADVIRRPAEVFGGQTALDWILAGRIKDVADAYDEGLYFQPD